MTPRRGFTLVELMVTIAVASILLMVVVPSFKSYFVKKKVEGTMAELSTDIQYARSEAVARNQNVRMAFGTNCYAIIVPATGAADSNCNATSGTSLRRVQVQDATAVSLAASSPLTGFQFDRVRGETVLDGMGTSDLEAAVLVETVGSGSPNYKLRAVVSKFGKVQVCTTNGMPGFSACS